MYYSWALLIAILFQRRFIVLTTGQQLQQMQVEQLFRQASECFEVSDYAAGLQLMSKCIATCPKNSALYSNRALFHSQLGLLDLAVEDLNTAINHNYLNYVAYFNLFSLQFNAGQTLEAFDNLCCSLSCLYLVRARKARRELDVQRSIKYAQNNPDAHILKALMYLDDGKNKLALNEIEWALDLGRYVPLCIKIKNIVNRRLNPYSISQIQDHQEPTPNFRLHTSYEPAVSFEEELRDRVREFNEIYDEIVNSEYGTVTQKVQRIRQDEPSNVNHSRSKLMSEISDIYEIKYKELSTNRQSKEKTSQGTKEQFNNENNQSQLLLEKHLEQASLQNHERHQELSQNGEQNLLDDDSLDKLQHQFVKETVNNQPVDECVVDQFNLLDEEQPPEPKVEQLYEENLLIPTIPSDNQIHHTDPPILANSTSASNNQSISLYPIGSKKKIQFTIVSAEVKTPAKMKDFYITGNYNSRKGQRLKTNNKKIQGNLVKWSTVISPTPISETMQTVTVKLFSKQYFSYDDELIGEGQVEIIKSGEMKFPVYYKNKVTGFVNLRVDLI